jgi:hypothetical protein
MNKSIAENLDIAELINQKLRIEISISKNQSRNYNLRCLILRKARNIFLNQI